MKTLPQELLSEIEKDFSFIVYAVEFEFSSGVKRYVNLDIGVLSNGLFYESRNFKYDNAIFTMKNEIDYLNLIIDNVDGEFTSILAQEDIRKRVVTIKVFAVQEPAHIVAESGVFKGIIDNAVIDDTQLNIRIANPLILWKTKTPRRIYQASCPWDFKSNECGYSGVETECDQSYDRCKALNNQNNYGGFRFLPSLQDKKIWWGRSQK